MAIIPPTPDGIDDCAIMQELKKKSSGRDGIAAKVYQFIEIVSPFLDIVSSGPFRNYTLHNSKHALKILHLMEYIIPNDTLNSLTPLEHLILIYSAYLHDIGMVITTLERNEILSKSEFQEVIREWPTLLNSLNSIRKQLEIVPEDNKAELESVIYQLHEAAICEYQRPRHATADSYRKRFDQLKKASDTPDLFSYKGVTFENILISICESHNLDAAVLSETIDVYNDRYPRDIIIAQQQLNTQYCASILRLADILDFDRERTPKILYDSLGIPSSNLPGAETSLKEWNKQLAIHSIDIRDDEIIISAECHHPAIEKTVREFCMIIEREIRDTTVVLKRNQRTIITKYGIELPFIVRPSIQSIGYSYRDLSLRLNQSSIISLLMGDKLYAHSGVTFRELIQNSLDACDVRKRISRDSTYVPQIILRSCEDKFGKKWFEIIDNGVGMDEHVISEYLLKVGDSYYQSNEFKREYRKIGQIEDIYNPISQYGIGILSVFMVADVLEVDTRSMLSPRGDKKGRYIRIEKFGGLAYVTDSDRSEPGTIIRIRVSQELIKDYDVYIQHATSYLRRLLIRPWYLINISLGEGHLKFSLPQLKEQYYIISKEGREELSKKGFVPIKIELERWSAILKGIVVVLLYKNNDGKLTIYKDGQRFVFYGNKRATINPQILVKNYQGNRICVNGFKVDEFRTKNLLRFKTGLKFQALIDIDVMSGNGIELDVSRERLTRKGDMLFRREFQKSIITAFNETGVMSELDEEIKLSIPIIPLTQEELLKTLTNRDEDHDALKGLYDSIISLIPDGKWPKGLHHQIANTLGVSSRLVSRVISGLLKTGTIKRNSKVINVR